MKVYAIVPVNEWAVEQDVEGVPALFLKEETANQYAAEISVDGLEYGVEEVLVNE